MYPKQIITSLLYKHIQMFVPYTSECEYRLGFGCNDKPWGVATIYIDPLIKPNKNN